MIRQNQLFEQYPEQMVPSAQLWKDVHAQLSETCNPNKRQMLDWAQNWKLATESLDQTVDSGPSAFNTAVFPEPTGEGFDRDLSLSA